MVLQYEFRMILDLFTADLHAVGNDELFAAIEEFAKAQSTEGWRHDYTEEWDDSALKTIAAFANTFGGLLVVGVRKRKGDVDCELLGVESEAEYKTRIASAIATNISPVPSYTVFECYKPNAPTKKFCLVRVRSSQSLHLLTKKGLQPVYVRNEDEARPADAAQLRRLIDREREAPSLPERIAERANRLRDALFVGCAYVNTGSESWYMAPHRRSETFLKLEMILSETRWLELEESHERSFRSLIAELYRRIPRTVQEGVGVEGEDRREDFYEYVWYHKNLDYESRWRITNTGDIGHASQMLYPEGDTGKGNWSVVDLAGYVILFLRLSMRSWEHFGYFGEGLLYAQLNVTGLGVLRGASGSYPHGFDATWSPLWGPSRVQISSEAILAPPRPRTAASTEDSITYFRGDEKLLNTTTRILIRLLRSLGYSVLRGPLENSIRPLIGG